MQIELNHTIVPGRNKAVAAEFFAKLVGATPSPVWGPFISVTVPPVNFEFIDIEDYAAATTVEPQHFAFLVDDEKFDTVFGIIQAERIPFFADQYLEEEGRINHHYGGRGVYLRDPDGHILEFITRPYQGTPHGVEKGRWKDAAKQMSSAEAE